MLVVETNNNTYVQDGAVQRKTAAVNNMATYQASSKPSRVASRHAPHACHESLAMHAAVEIIRNEPSSQ